MKTTRSNDAAQDATAPTSRPPSGPRFVEAANSDWSRPDAADTFDSAKVSNLVIVLNGDGIVRSVVEVPPDTGNRFPREMQGLGVEDIWPAATARSIREDLRRALRSRQVRTSRLHVEEWGRDYELIYIAQGRDSVMVVARDISDAEERITRLERLAFHDEVTDLPNRDWLLGELRSAVERVRLHRGRAAVICLDLANLDIVAKASSPETRDVLLRELASRLKTDLRGANRPGEHDDERYSAIARLAFNRFVVVLPSIETGEDAAAVTERLVGLLEQPLDADGRSVSVQVSAGIALYPQDGASADELLAGSVTAVEDAKCSGTQQQRFHSGTVRMRALDRQDLEQELRAAVDGGEFTLAFQPIVTTSGRRIAAAEALLRWPKPLFGTKSISDVIAVAEFTGLILPIGEWVFSKACEQLKEWRDAGHSALQLAVNVSAQEFARADLVERTERIVRDTGVDLSGVVLEITERLLFRDSLDDYAVCRALKELGVGISVDDYGTGVCSFDHLSRSPVDSVKIHPQIVARSGTEGPSRAACAAVTAMAHALGVRVIAEGVETEEQAAMLDEIGCDYLQGYLFGRPVEALELDAQHDAESAS